MHILVLFSSRTSFIYYFLHIPFPFSHFLFRPSVCYLCTFDIALRSRHQILRFLHDPSSAGAPTPSSLFIGASPSLLTGPGAWLLLVHGLVTSFTRAAVYVASDELEYALLLERPHVATRHCRRAHLLTKSILAPQVVLEVLMLPFLSVANRMFGQYLGLVRCSFFHYFAVFSLANKVF